MRTTEASRKLQGKTPVEAMAEMMAEAVAEAARAVVAEAVAEAARIVPASIRLSHPYLRCRRCPVASCRQMPSSTLSSTSPPLTTRCPPLGQRLRPRWPAKRRHRPQRWRWTRSQSDVQRQARCFGKRMPSCRQRTKSCTASAASCEMLSRGRSRPGLRPRALPRSATPQPPRDGMATPVGVPYALRATVAAVGGGAAAGARVGGGSRLLRSCMCLLAHVHV